MSSSSLQSSVTRVASLLDQLRSSEPSRRPIGADESLPDAGVSSLQLVNLMLAIEADFDVFIPPQDVNPKNFSSLAAIAALVERLQSFDPA